MERDVDKLTKEKMSQASLHDYMPGFDAEREWQEMAARLHPATKRKALPIRGYVAAAAILLLVAAAGAGLFIAGNKPQLATKPQQHDSPLASPVASNISTAPGATAANTIALATMKHPDAKQPHHDYTTKYIISNNTDCPMQISINQTMKCPNRMPAAISATSTLAPGQSAPLNYAAGDSVQKNCSLTVKQIQIESIATGEAITLDAHSSPATAQEVFSYISGEKRGDVLAGVFKLDCNKKDRRHSLRLDNRAGNVIMQ